VLRRDAVAQVEARGPGPQDQLGAGGHRARPAGPKIRQRPQGARAEQDDLVGLATLGDLAREPVYQAHGHIRFRGTCEAAHRGKEPDVSNSWSYWNGNVTIRSLQAATSELAPPGHHPRVQSVHLDDGLSLCRCAALQTEGAAVAMPS
jgi:hypothetical protein